jgi:ATP-dependent Clp protease ATP-binding subunit ClpA
MGVSFTKRSAESFRIASNAARSFQHEYIKSEHVLLGVLSGDCEGRKALSYLGVDLDAMFADIERAMLPREFAIEEASTFRKGGRLADTADFLVGVLTHNQSAAAVVLGQHGVTGDKLRAAAIEGRSANYRRNA